MQGTKTGVGSALKKARLVRGVTLDEASRDTKLRLDSLSALEDEDFGSLLGDVYVRGALRSYAAYLGLDAERIVLAYAEAAPEPTPPAVPQSPAVVARRRPGSHRRAVVVVGTLIAGAAAVGVISSRDPAPPPAPLEKGPVVSEAQAESRIDVTLVSSARVNATVTIDGQARRLTLLPEEQRSFMAVNTIELRLERGGLVDVTVNGNALGAPGRRGKPWQKTFSYDEDA